MKKLFLIPSLFCSALFAALPPLEQSSREIQAVLNDSRIQTLLGSAELIQEIIRVEGGYVILTSHYLLRVDVEYLRSEHPGPIPFELHFQDPVELQGR